MNKITRVFKYFIAAALLAGTAEAVTFAPLSSFGSGGNFNTATDKVVTVRNGGGPANPDVLTGLGGVFVPYTGATAPVNLGNFNLGFGTASPAYAVDVERSVNGVSGININNPNSGATAQTQFRSTNDLGHTTDYGIFSSGFNPAAGPVFAPDTALLLSDGAQALNIWSAGGSINLGAANAGDFSGNYTLSLDVFGNTYLNVGNLVGTRTDNPTGIDQQGFQPLWLGANGIFQLQLNPDGTTNIVSGISGDGNPDFLITNDNGGGRINVVNLWPDSSQGVKLILGDSSVGAIVDLNNFAQFGRDNSTDLFFATQTVERLRFNSSGYAQFSNGRISAFAGASPTALLHIGAGSNSLPPFKFTSGTLLTTPATGAEEFDGTHFYGDIGSSRFQLDRQVAAGTGITTSVSGGVATVNSSAESTLSFQPGLLTSVTATVGVFGKMVKASTVDNIIGSAYIFSCISNPTITMYECGTSTTCATPTTIGTVTVTAAGTAFTGSISNAAITAGDLVGWAVTAGTCTSLDISANAQVHSN